jgi:hypothetical protein
LETPIARDDRPHQRLAYPWWGVVAVSVYVLYHVAVLLVHNLPSKGLAEGLRRHFAKPCPQNTDTCRMINDSIGMNDYMRATGNTQSWAMFAPNPHRHNVFMRVLVKDKSGEVWDLKHDIYGKRAYPYLFYDRMGKINRRIIDQKGYRRHYAAWVCRDWERAHDGEPAVEVQFVKLWTVIPPPNKVFRFMGYDPMKLHLHERDEETIRCASTRQAQLPDHLLERFGIEPPPGRSYLELYTRTWWDKQKHQQPGGSTHRATRPDNDDEKGNVAEQDQVEEAIE